MSTISLSYKGISTQGKTAAKPYEYVFLSAGADGVISVTPWTKEPPFEVTNGRITVGLKQQHVNCVDFLNGEVDGITTFMSIGIQPVHVNEQEDVFVAFRSKTPWAERIGGYSTGCKLLRYPGDVPRNIGDVQNLFMTVEDNMTIGHGIFSGKPLKSISIGGLNFPCFLSFNPSIIAPRIQCGVLALFETMDFTWDKYASEGNLIFWASELHDKAMNIAFINNESGHLIKQEGRTIALGGAYVSDEELPETMPTAPVRALPLLLEQLQCLRTIQNKPKRRINKLYEDCTAV